MSTPWSLHIDPGCPPVASDLVWLEGRDRQRLAPNEPSVCLRSGRIAVRKNKRVWGLTSHEEAIDRNQTREGGRELNKIEDRDYMANILYIRSFMIWFLTSIVNPREK